MKTRTLFFLSILSILMLDGCKKQDSQPSLSSYQICGKSICDKWIWVNTYSSNGGGTPPADSIIVLEIKSDNTYSIQNNGHEELKGSYTWRETDGYYSITFNNIQNLHSMYLSSIEQSVIIDNCELELSDLDYSLSPYYHIFKR